MSVHSTQGPNTTWASARFTPGNHGQGNHEPAPPTPLHKITEDVIDKRMAELLEEWNSAQQECKDAYYREGRHAKHNTRPN